MLLLYAFLTHLTTLLPFVASYTTLSDSTLKSLPGPGTDFNILNGALLAPILRPRVPGTPGSIAVLKHFVDFFHTQLPAWNITFQNSTSKTPLTGNTDVPFVNLIATRDPPWTEPGEVGRLALVAHYDSKITPEGFIGATDSAAPCAMIMHAVRSVDDALTKKWAKMEAEGVGKGGFEGVEEEKGLQVLLLDGEEAFESWTETDSLYGARALAESWEQTQHPALSTYHNSLSSISLFLLLDLLGAANPTVPSYFKTTHWAYQSMAALEVRLRDLRLFWSSPNHSSKRNKPTKDAQNQVQKARMNKPRKEPLFLTEADKKGGMFRGWMVQDDHVPFMARGVEVLHLIPTPFPRVWHEMDDDGEHLDDSTVEDWARLITAFVGEWMDLEGFFNVVPNAAEERGLHVPTSKTELRKGREETPELEASSVTLMADDDLANGEAAKKVISEPVAMPDDAVWKARELEFEAAIRTYGLDTVLAELATRYHDDVEALKKGEAHPWIQKGLHKMLQMNQTKSILQQDVPTVASKLTHLWFRWPTSPIRKDDPNAKNWWGSGDFLEENEEDNLEIEDPIRDSAVDETPSIKKREASTTDLQLVNGKRRSKDPLRFLDYYNEKSYGYPIVRSKKMIPERHIHRIVNVASGPDYSLKKLWATPRPAAPHPERPQGPVRPAVAGSRAQEQDVLAGRIPNFFPGREMQSSDPTDPATAAFAEKMASLTALRRFRLHPKVPYTAGSSGFVELPDDAITAVPLQSLLDTSATKKQTLIHLPTLEEINELWDRVYQAENEVLQRETYCRVCRRPFRYDKTDEVAAHYATHRDRQSREPVFPGT
ncbi:hypothetical protein B0A49_06501, partial [Cryomyces minteri]